MPGCAAKTGTVTGALVMLLFSTATWTVDLPATPNGTWKLICCCPLTLSDANNGTAEPSTSTELHKYRVANGSDETKLIPVAETMLVPKTVAISPGTTPPPTKLAPFTTALITGGSPPATLKCKAKVNSSA